MKMYEKLGIDLTTAEGLKKALNFCPHTFTHNDMCTDKKSCNQCRAEYLTQEVREVTYRPYKDTKEMIEDFKDRFGVYCPSCGLPFIWIKSTLHNSWILANYIGSHGLFIDNTYLDMKKLYSDYTYLDGSPIGIKN